MKGPNELTAQLDILNSKTVEEAVDFIGECESSINDLAEYFSDVIPSRVRMTLIPKTEALLKMLHRRFDADRYLPAVEEAIIGSLSVASALTHEIEMGGKDVLIELGEHSYLATVFSGRSGKRLYMQSKRTISSLESRFKTELHDWDGNTGKFNDIEGILKTTMPFNFEGNTRTK